MPMRGVVEYVGSPEATAKELRAAVKAELLKVIELWHEKMLPQHFRTSAKTVYRYQERGEKYQRDKLKDVGHNRPLEYSGDMKHMVSRQIRPTATAKGARGRMKGPHYLYAYRKNFKQPDKADEMTRTTRHEVLTLARSLDRGTTHRLNNVKTKETKTI